MAAHQTLAGKYVLVRKIATTPTAEVFLAGRKTPSGQDEQVIVKRMLPRATPDAVKRFEDEGRIASLLQHPSCIRVLEVGAMPPVRYVVYEHVTGQPLQRVQEAAVKKLGRLPIPFAIGIVLDLARALAHAHQQSDLPCWPLGVVHGSVCPQNVLVGYDGVARLVEFGTVAPNEKIADLDGPTQLSRLAYAAPERAAGGLAEKSGDLFALGLLLYELTTGRAAYAGATAMELSLQVMECAPTPPGKLVPGYPMTLERVVKKAIARDPAQRFATGRELESALNATLAALKVGTSAGEVGAAVRELFGLGAVAPGKAEPPREDTAPVVVGTIPVEAAAAPTAAAVATAEAVPSSAAAPLGAVATPGAAARRAPVVVEAKTEPFATPPAAPAVPPPASVAVAAPAAAPAQPATPVKPPPSSAIDAETIAQLRRELDAALMRDAASRKEVEVAKAEARVATDKLSALERQLQDAKAEMEAARQAANEADERVEEAKKDVERAAAKEAEAEHRIAEAQREVDAAKKEIAAAKASVAEAEKKLAAEKEAAAKREAEHAAQAQRALLDAESAAKKREEAALEKVKALENELASVKGLESSAKDEIARALQERDAALARESEAQKLAAAAKEELEAEKWAAKTLRDASRRAVEEAETAAKTARDEAERAAQRAAESDRAAEAAKTELAEGIAREALARLRAEEADRRLAAAAAETEALRGVVERARRDAAKAKAEGAALASRVEVQKREVESAKNLANKESEAAQAKITAAQKEIEESKRAAQEALESLKEARAEIEVLRGELAKTLESADAARKEAAAAITEREDAKKKVAVLERDLVVARAEINAAKRGADMALERAEQLEEELAELKRKRPKAPPRPAGPTPTNLTADAGAIVGRVEEMKVLELLLAEVPVVILAGAEGMGRTRLARAFAWKWKEERSPPGGVFHVDLADARDSEGVRAIIARTLGIHVPAKLEDDDAIEHLGAEIAGRGEMLVVLDGVDSTSRAVRTLVERWAPAAAAVFLVCARTPIGIREERVVELKGLGLPADGQIDSPASALFAHLMSARREKKPTDAMMQAIARLVVQLEGNPLAIELAAARTEMFTPAKLLANLGAHEPPAEGGVVAWVLEWSWTLLTAWEQEAFAQACLFRRSFDAEAASAVIDLSGHAGGSSVAEALASLQAQGLLQSSGAGWYMHPAVRTHAATRLAASAKRDRAAARHEAWATKAGRIDELETVAERALAVEPPTAASAASAARAVTSLAAACATTGPYTRLLAWLDAAIEQAKRLKVEKRILAEALAARGSLRRRRGKVDEGLTDLYDAHDIAAGDRDRRFEAKVLAEIGLTLQEKGKAEKAKRALEQALAMARGAKDAALEREVQDYLSSVG